MRQWEYLEVHMSSNDYRASDGQKGKVTEFYFGGSYGQSPHFVDAVDVCNEYGRLGWELVTAVGPSAMICTLWFKRLKEP